MEQKFWHSCWEKGQIGFHQPEGHPLLHKYWPVLDLATPSRILVPMCGKSQDMIWLAEQGHYVIGIELSAIAAREFFQDHDLSYRRKKQSGFDCFIGQNIEIHVGDFFELSAAALGRFDGFYDRAALIALPEEMRRRYVAHLMTHLRRATVGLLISLDYDPALMDGPPFNVGDEAVGCLYGEYAHVDLMAEQRGLAEDNPLRARGLNDAREGVYRIVRI